MPDRKLFACYNPRFFLATVGVAVMVVGAAFLSRGMDKGSAPRLALGALQAVAMGGLILYTVLVLRRLDEMQQRIQFESLAVAFGISGALITASSFLEKAGLPGVDWGAWAYPLMAASWVISLIFVRRRYL